MSSRHGVTAPTPYDQEKVRRGRDGARSSLAAQWLGLFLAPVTFFAHLQLAFVLVPWSCATSSGLRLGATHAVALLLAVVGTMIARRVWVTDDVAADGPIPASHARARFLGIVGTVISAMFVLLLAAQWAASLFLSPCQ